MGVVTCLLNAGKEDLESPLGGNFVPLKYKLIDPSEFHLVIGIKLNNIMDVYMRSHPRKIIAPEKISQSVKGIEQCTGIISNLFDDPHALQRQEHAFFIPCEGALSLTQEEIQQLLCELARGIFLHDQVPFFSLHANFNLTHYPVVQPIYQGLIGYFLSMLDYYMKGLSANRFYSEEFILEWSKNPLIDEALFSKNSLKFSDYCGEEIYSLDEIIEQLTKKQATGGVSQERKIKNYQAGVTIVAKQNAIHYTDGLFILDGDFDLVPHLYPASPLPGEEAYHALLSNACDILCAQTKRVLTSLPFLKKHCEALSIINFFSYYFNTLKKAGQVPSLIHRFFPDNGKICPSIFPPYLKNATHPKRPQIRVLDLLEQMQVKQRLEVCAAIKNEQLTEGSIQYFAQALQEYATCFLAENNEFKDLSFCQQIAHILLSKCSLGHKAVHTSLGQGLVRLSFKKEGEPITEEVVRKYLIEVEDRLKESQELLRKQQDLILKSQDQAQLHLRKTDLLSIEKHREELLALQQTWSAWLQEPLKVSLEGIFAVFDFIQGSPLFL
ncbi:MAG: hypothetical protein LVR00_08355 [Rhabdochlamydiaceae bacterium]|jgi:hypothetical protein